MSVNKDDIILHFNKKKGTVDVEFKNLLLTDEQAGEFANKMSKSVNGISMLYTACPDENWLKQIVIEILGYMGIK